MCGKLLLPYVQGFLASLALHDDLVQPPLALFALLQYGPSLGGEQLVLQSASSLAYTSPS